MNVTLQVNVKRNLTTSSFDFPAYSVLPTIDKVTWSHPDLAVLTLPALYRRTLALVGVQESVVYACPAILAGRTVNGLNFDIRNVIMGN